MAHRPTFLPVDAALIRVPVHRGWSGPWPDLTGHAAELVPGWREWLRLVWERDRFAEAVELASPLLAGRVGEVCAGRVAAPDRVRRVVESVLRYLLRSSGRATPFGMFAGVAPARLGRRTTVTWGDRHRAVARPDAGWLAAATASLAGRPDVLNGVPLVVNDLGFPRGGRWVLPHQAGADGRVGEVSVRYSDPVRVAIAAAGSPATFTMLRDQLTARFPGTPAASIEAMLTRLVSTRILLSSLHAPMDVTDPLAHLADQIAATGSAQDEGGSFTRLRGLHASLGRHAQLQSPTRRRELRAHLSRRMLSLASVDADTPLLAVDLRVDCAVILTPAVFREAQDAADALLRLCPHPTGTPAWIAYHRRFLERYGPGAIIPLAQVVNPDTGLGFPAGYRGAPPQPPTALTGRDRRLLRLAQQAAFDGGEVVLDDHEIDRLSSGVDPRLHPVPHTELRFSLHAPTTEAIDRGEFSLVVDSASRQAGTTIGRFLHLLDPADRDRMARGLAGLPTLSRGALHTQVCCAPLSTRTLNVARAPLVFPPLPIGEHRPPHPQAVRWDELAVTADAHQMYLLRPSDGRIVEPVALNAVEFRHATHPLARFLCEIATSRTAACVPFDWPAAGDLPFLPRVRYRRSVLRPASWRLSAADLPGPTAGYQDWLSSWQVVRRRYRLPRLVYLGGTDTRLRLDLDEPAHLALLRTDLTHEGNTVLTEAPDANQLGWIGGRTHQIVVPMANTTTPTAARARSRRLSVHPGHAPGVSSVIYAHINANPDRHTEILTEHLPELLSDTETDGWTWWFLRYQQPEPHLRLRVRLPDTATFGTAAARIGAWVNQLRRTGLAQDLSLHTYHPETGRYGSGPCMRAAEDVFATDSVAAQAALTIAAHLPQGQLALTVAGMIDLAAGFTADTNAGLAWLAGIARPTPSPALPRPTRDDVLHLADPLDDYAALRAVPGGGDLLRAWQHRRTTLTFYRAVIGKEDSISPDEVLGSLLHLHHARAIGINPESERACLHLARAAAQRSIRRRGGIPSPSQPLTVSPQA